MEVYLAVLIFVIGIMALCYTAGYWVGRLAGYQKRIKEEFEATPPPEYK